MSSTFIEDTRLNYNQTPQSQSIIPHVNGQDSSVHGRPTDRLTPIQRPLPSSTGPFRTHSALTSSELKSNSTVPATLSDPTPLSTYRRQDRDDDNSSEMHDKLSNPFAVNNDIPAINFNAHLQKTKSLFSNKSYLSSSRSLSNYRLRRQPSYSSSLYRSTSSLCDNNSSASTPSAFASPFYNGQTTFGGASSQSKRFKSAFQPDQLQLQHRSNVPSKLIPSSLSKSTSSLNSVDSGTSCLSTTAKRILDLMNQFNTPLAEVRQISNALPLPGNIRRQPPSLLDNESIGIDAADRIRRKLLKPNTPYNRPIGRTAEYNFTNELKVPSMSQLLQLKKNTIQVREIANNSNSTLNRREEYKLPSIVEADVNLKKTNNNIEPQSIHVNKIRNNLTKKKVKTGKTIVDDSPVEAVNLPNIQLPFNKDVAVTFSKLPHTPNISSSVTSSKVTPVVNQSSAVSIASVPTKATFSFGATLTNEEKKSDSSREKSDTLPAPTPKFSFNSSPSTSKPQFQNNNTLTAVPKFSFGNNVNTEKPIATTPVATNTEQKSCNLSADYTFAQPIFVQSTSAEKSVSYEESIYKFSEPIFILEKSSTGSILNTSTEKKVSSIKGIGDFKFPPTAPSTSAPATNSIDNFSFGLSKNASPISIAAQSTLSSSGFEFGKSVFGTASKTDSTVVAQTKLDTFNKSAVNSTISSNDDKKQTSEDTKNNNKSYANLDDVFKSIAAKQKSGKWDCDSCMTRNDISSKTCLACEAPQPGANVPAAAAGHAFTAPNSNQSADNVFKSIAAKQNSSAWECSACLTKNDNSKTNCACCNQLRDKPTTTTPVATSSNVKPSPAVDDVFKAIAAKQKSTSWECSACFTKNDTSKTKCACCDQLKEGAQADNSSSTEKPPASQFSFGTLGSNAFSAKPVTTQFSFGSGNSTFASKPAASNSFTFGSGKTTDSKAPASQFGSSTSGAKKTTGQFSFGSSHTTPEKASTSQFAFGGAQTAKPTEPAAAKPPIDDVFKKIVSEQTAKWECTSCMTKNDSTVSKCVCCETPKNGASTDAKPVLGSQSKFSFGAPSTKFSFGAQPAKNTVESAKSTAVSTTSTTYSSSTSGSYTFGNATSSPATITSTNTFKSPSTNLFSSPAASVADAPKTTAVSPGFQFGFGTPTSIPSAASNHTSKDVTDTSNTTKIPANVEGVKVLENVLIKPSINGPGPDDKRQMFGFGSSNLSSLATEQKSPNVSTFSTATTNPTTNSTVFGSSSASSANMFKPATAPTFGLPTPLPPSSVKSTVNPPFVFGQSNTNNSVGGFGTKRPAETTSSPVVVPKSTFSFGSAATANNNSAAGLAASAAANSQRNRAPPAFGSSASFSFGTPSTVSNSAVAPVFGASSFPSKGGSLGEAAFKPSFSFGSGASPNVPTFGNPVPTTNAANVSLIIYNCIFIYLSISVILNIYTILDIVL